MTRPYSNERVNNEITFRPAMAPPNGTLWHIGTGQYFSTFQGIHEKLRKWLRINWSRHPYLAKWLALNPPSSSRDEDEVFDMMENYPFLFPDLLSMLYNLWEESPNNDQVPLHYWEGPEYSGRQQIHPPHECHRAPPLLPRTYQFFRF